MPDSTNTHLASVQTLGDGGSGGTNLTAAATDKSADYGTSPAVQASAIPAVTGGVSLTTTMNAILSVLRSDGKIAA